MDQLFSTLTFFGFFQGLFLLSVLGFSPKHRKTINPYLLILIGVLVIGLLGRTLYVLQLFGNEPRLLTISEFALMLFGPAFALFVKSSLKHETFDLKELKHFIPALFHIAYLTSYFILASDEVIEGRFASGELIRIVLTLGVIGLIVNLSYWGWSWKMLSEYRQSMNKELSYVTKIKFLFWFLIAIAICMLSVLILLLLTYLQYELFTRVTYMLVWLSLTIVILFLGFYSITEPDLFKIKLEENQTKYLQSKLTKGDLVQLKQDLDQLMLSQKPYLNKKLMKAELSDLLGVNSREMSRLLNEGFGMNFFEYVNFYRIKEFINLVESEQYPNFTFVGIAEVAGFNSKATFNKAFKNIMGKTPRQYFS